MIVSNEEALFQLSHEIRNHLTQITLASKLLQLELEGVLSEEQQHGFEQIDEGARQIVKLVATVKRVTAA